MVDGRPVIPADYLRDATTIVNKHESMLASRRKNPFHYGNHLHIMPLRTRTFAFLGIGGQRMYVQPTSGLVMVRTGVEEVSQEAVWGPPLHALWLAVLEHLGGDAVPEGG